MIEQATINGLALHDERAYKMEFGSVVEGFEIVPVDVKPQHPAHVVRLYDENDELDVEVVTDQPHVFSITFLKEPRTITAISIEPINVPADKSLS
jgi:galactose mutarotase-like enzyme